MHPIEKIHNMIISGNILGPKGTWVSRTDALKKKRYILKHVLNGEVEVDGRWVKLNEVDINPKHPPPIVSLPTPATPEQPAQPSIQLPPNVYHDNSPSQRLVDRNTSDRKPYVKHTVHDDSHYSDLPPQPQVGTPPKVPEETDTFQKETITIRTIPLGKETSLTISESRAGSALVAICSVQGFIDQTNSDDFHMQLISMLDFGVRYFIIDLKHTTLIGSAGWGVLAVAARLIKAANGHLMICEMSDEIEESFFVLQFDEVIDAQKTISDCLDVIRTTIQNQKNSIPDNNDEEDSMELYGESYDDLPLPERIKTIIAQNGPLSFFRIIGILKQERYGKVKINPIRLYLLLRELNLETNFKRVRFYRSC
jgi:anti-anti-sigma factor